MRRFLLIAACWLCFPGFVFAQVVQYDEAIDGDLDIVVGQGPTVTVTLAPGVNTVTGTFGFDGTDADIDFFYMIVPDGAQIESINFEYQTTIFANPGYAGYTFYIDGTGVTDPNGVAPSERAEVTDVPSESREYYADLMPLGPGQYGLGRPGSSRPVDMIFDVDYTWTIVVSGDEPPPPEPVVLDVPRAIISAGERPVVDGDLSFGEWEAARRHDIDGGFLAFIHDRERLYVQINMLGDDGDDPFNAGGGDQFWLYFDVDRDGAITPGVDRRYRLDSGTGNLRYQTFCDDCPFGFDPLEVQTFSARGEGFGCYVADGTVSFIPLACNSHRLWEVAIDLTEIGLNGDRDIRMGWLVASGTPLQSQSFPADLNDIANYAQLTLEGTAVSRSTSGRFDLGDPQFEITQTIQTPDNVSDLAAGKPTAVRAWSSTSSDASETYIYGQRNGIDLPGSPLKLTGFLALYYDPEDSRDTDDRIQPLPESWAVGGNVDFDMRVRHRDGSIAFQSDATIDFAPTRVPVFWAVPVRNTVNSGPTPTVTVATDAQIDAHEQFTSNAVPIWEIDHIRRPIFDVQNITSSAAMKTQLKTYDQQALLAWTLGLLLTGESPFDIPDQVTGFLGQSFGSTQGSSDRIGKPGGAGRIAWVNANRNPAFGTYAHELNHNLDKKTTSTWGLHSRGCNAASGGALDPSWPYGSSSKIQEVGVFWNGTQFSSVTDQTDDLMSYCSVGTVPRKWFSPYRWDAWLTEFRTDTSMLMAKSFAAAAASSPVDSFYILGRINRDGTGELGQVLRQPGLPPGGGVAGDYAVRVLDCAGGVLVEDGFSVILDGDEGEAFDHAAFDSIVTAPAGACALALVSNGATLDYRELSANVPSVSLLAPNGGEVWEGDVSVRWQANDGDGDDLTFALLYSPDGGMTWQPLASGLTGNEVTLDSNQVPGSDDARLRILATDGGNTGEDDTDLPFHVVDKPPTVSIIAPVDGDSLDGAKLQTFRGRARDTFGNRLSADALLWEIDSEPAGIGEAVSTFLEVGEHQVTLVYRENGVMLASATVMVTVEDATEITDPPDDDLPGGVDIVAVDATVDGDRWNCELTLRGGKRGLPRGSMHLCALDFDDLELESRNYCDADRDRRLTGSYRLGDNGRCATADVVLLYRKGWWRDLCLGPNGTQCVQREVAADGGEDDRCDGSVSGQPAVNCRVSISAPLAEIATRRDAECADADDGCFGGIDEATGDYAAYAHFRSRLWWLSDRVPNTDDGRVPNDADEVVVTTLRR